MLTGANAFKSTIFLLLTAVINVSAQDTVNIKPFERYWTKATLVPRIGVGAQGVAFAEVGVQHHQIYVHPLALASSGPHISLEGVVADRKVILGPKVGYEIAAGLLGLGVDLTVYTDFTAETLVLTPKAGLSIFGFANLFYGYNAILSDNHFPVIGHNRFSLSFSLNRDYFSVRSAPKKR